MLNVTVAILSVCLIVQQYLHYMERKDFVNRLMARDTAEYKELSGSVQHRTGLNFYLKKDKKEG